MKRLPRLTQILLALLGSTALAFADYDYTARSLSPTSVTVNPNPNVNRNANDNPYDDFHSGHYYSHDYQPPSTAVASDPTSVTLTSPAIGTVRYDPPPAYTTVVIAGITYMQAGNTWYQPQFMGTTTTYVVVIAPR